jgi:hypothetical protein
VCRTSDLICYAGQMEAILEDFVSKQSQVISGQERLLEKLESMTKQLKPGSECTVSDWQKFGFQGRGSLKIPILTEESFANVYNKIYTSKKKFKIFPDSPQEYSFADALSHLDLAEEKKIMHPITTHLLTQSLARRPSCGLKLASEVGYYSDRYCMYGFSDKAAFFDFDYDPADGGEPDSPDNYRPSTRNISQPFYSPVPLLGAIEEKALRRDLDSPAFAQLAGQMAGFVEAAQVVKSFNYKSFPGLLIGVVESNGRHELVGHCVLWTQANGQESRQISKLLRSRKEFCSGVEWWLQQCEALLEAVKKIEHQRRQGRLPLLVSFSDASGTGSDQGEKDAGDQDTVDEASTLLQSISVGSAPSRRVCKSELSEHVVKLAGIFGDCKRTDSWVSAALASLQARKLQAGF